MSIGPGRGRAGRPAMLSNLRWSQVRPNTGESASWPFKVTLTNRRRARRSARSASPSAMPKANLGPLILSDLAAAEVDQAVGRMPSNGTTDNDDHSDLRETRQHRIQIHRFHVPIVTCNRTRHPGPLPGTRRAAMPPTVRSGTEVIVSGEPGRPIAQPGRAPIQAVGGLDVLERPIGAVRRGYSVVTRAVPNGLLCRSLGTGRVQLWSRCTGGSHGDEDLSPGVSLFEVADGGGSVAQRVGLVDHWRDLPGLEKFAQDGQILLGLVGQEENHPLAHRG